MPLKFHERLKGRSLNHLHCYHILTQDWSKTHSNVKIAELFLCADFFSLQTGGEKTYHSDPKKAESVSLAGKLWHQYSGNQAEYFWLIVRQSQIFSGTYNESILHNLDRNITAKSLSLSKTLVLYHHHNAPVIESVIATTKLGFNSWNIRPIILNFDCSRKNGTELLEKRWIKWNDG